MRSCRFRTADVDLLSAARFLCAADGPVLTLESAAKHVLRAWIGGFGLGLAVLKPPLSGASGSTDWACPTRGRQGSGLRKQQSSPFTTSALCRAPAAIADAEIALLALRSEVLKRSSRGARARSQVGPSPS